MAESNVIQEQWVDIPPLPVTAEEFSLLTILISIVVVLLVSGGIYYLLRMPRSKALRRLRRIASEPIETRQQLSMLHQALLCGLNISHLHEKEFDEELQPEWEAFYSELKQVRFQSGKPTGDDVKRFVSQARIWIKKA